MSEEFKPFTIKVETPEDAVYLACLIEWSNEPLDAIIAAIRGLDNDLSENSSTLLALIKDRGATGDAIWDQIPHNVQFWVPEDFSWYGDASPYKIGCRTVKYSSEGIDLGDGYTLTPKQLRAMADKCDGKGE